MAGVERIAVQWTLRMREMDVCGSQLRVSPAQLLIFYAICYTMQFTTALLELLYTELRRITIKHRKRYLDVLARVHSAVVHA